MHATVLETFYDPIKLEHAELTCRFLRLIKLGSEQEQSEIVRSHERFRFSGRI